MGGRERVYSYEAHGVLYGGARRTDPRIQERILAALGDARTVANVGAGTGSYEPEDRHVLAFEPSAVMRSQRPPGRPAVAASAEALPLDDNSVDAAMALLTVQHWSDRATGVRELRRVARDRVVILTIDPQAASSFWLVRDYLPEVLAADRRRFPPARDLARELGGADIEVVMVPADCRDGFFHAYYGRPEAYLDHAVRAAQSAWPQLPHGVEERALAALAADLESGAWDARYGHLRSQPEQDTGVRLVVATFS